MAIRLSGLLIDLTPWHSSADFRRLLMGGSVTALGAMITYVAMPFQIAALTGSFVMVGLLALVEIVPLIVLGLYGGVIADAFDRRTTVILTEISATVVTTLLLVNSLLAEPQVWVVFVAAVLFASTDAIARPSLDAITPRVVAHDQLPAAAALSSIRGTVAQIAGPAIGGLLLAVWGPAAAYSVDVLTYVVSIAFLLRLSPIPAGASSAPVSFKRVTEGLAYAWSRKDLLGTYLIDSIAMIFAFSWSLFPFLAQALGAPWSLGLMYSAGAVGAAVATFTSGWTSRVHRHGRAIVFAAIAWGLAVACVGLTVNLAVVLLLLAIAGGADMISGVFRQAMWNQTIPDDLRGRMAGVELLSYSIGPQLGQARAGLTAQVFSLRSSFVMGGIACAAMVATVGRGLPDLWNYDDRTNEHAVRERAIRAAQSPESPPQHGN